MQRQIEFDELEQQVVEDLTVALGVLETASAGGVQEALTEAVLGLKSASANLVAMRAFARAAYRRTCGDGTRSSGSTATLVQGLSLLMGADSVVVEEAKVEVPLEAVESLLELLEWTVKGERGTATLVKSELTLTFAAGNAKLEVTGLGAMVAGVPASFEGGDTLSLDLRGFPDEGTGLGATAEPRVSGAWSADAQARAVTGETRLERDDS